METPEERLTRRHPAWVERAHSVIGLAGLITLNRELHGQASIED